MYQRKPLHSDANLFGDGFNSIYNPSRKTTKKDKPVENTFDEDLLLRELENKRGVQISEEKRVTFRDPNNGIQGSKHEISDPGVKDLLGQIDALMDRIGGPILNNNDHLTRTGCFVNNSPQIDDVQIINFDDITPRSPNFGSDNKPKQQQQTISQKANKKSLNIQPILKSQRKQESSSESSSDNSDFEYSKQKQNKKSKSKHKHKKRSKHRKEVSSSSSNYSESSVEKYKSHKSKSRTSNVSKNRQLQQPAQLNMIQQSHRQQSQTPQKKFKQQQRSKEKFQSLNNNINQSYIKNEQPYQVLQDLHPQGKTSNISSQINYEEIFCLVCEEFINAQKVDDHCKYCQPCQQKQDLKNLNDKLIKINYILNHKSRAFVSQQIIKCSHIVEGCANKIIQINDSLDSLAKLVADLTTITDSIFLIETMDINQSQEIQVLQSLTLKLQEFSYRKLDAVKEEILISQKQSRILTQKPNMNMSSTKNFNSTNSKIVLDDDKRSLVSNVQSYVVYKHSAQPQMIVNNPIQNHLLLPPPPQKINPNNLANTVKLQPNNNLSNQSYRQQKSESVNKKKLFDLENQQQFKKPTLLIQNRLNNTGPQVTVMGASKAVLIEQKNQLKENNSEVEWQGIINQLQYKKSASPYEFTSSITPPKRKDGIQFGNDPQVQRPFIMLSSPKKNVNNLQNSNHKNQNNDGQNEYEYHYKPEVSKQKQKEEKKPKSIISGISEFLSKISIIPSAPPQVANTEAQKKKFFDLAVKKKQEIHCQHPSQNILIAELYDKCRRDNIPEDQWEKWIWNIYIKAT